jgi:hypothetical protein
MLSVSIFTRNTLATTAQVAATECATDSIEEKSSSGHVKIGTFLVHVGNFTWMS